MNEDIKRFIAVAQLQSFTKAAETLHITQPALSISIKKLEQYIHASLFEAKTKPLTLSAEGKVVYDMGKKILFQWDKLSDAAFRNSILGKKHIVIGVFDSAAIQMASIFKDIAEKKDFSLDITIDNSQTLWKQLRTGILDICICVIQKDTKSADNSITCEYLYEEPFLPIANSTKWNNTALEKIPFILYTQQSTSRTYINDFFLKNNITPTVIAESTSTSFMKALALQGLGVALLPKSIVATELKQKSLSTVLPNLTISRKVGVYIQKNQMELVKPILKQITNRLHI